MMSIVSKALFVLAPAMCAATVLAQTPPGVSDLVGARAAGGETQLQARGYVHVKTEKGDDRAWSYWWHADRRECLTVATVDGRYDAITSTPAPDCNQPAGAGGAAASSAPAQAPAKVNDLITMLAPNADIELQKRGFRTVRAYQAGENSYTIRTNAQTGQCVQVAVTDNRVRYISPLKASSCR